MLGLTVKDSGKGAGVTVTKLEPKSQLAACGLNVGETIVSIGSTLVKDHASTIKAIDEAPMGAPRTPGARHAAGRPGVRPC